MQSSERNLVKHDWFLSFRKFAPNVRPDVYDEYQNDQINRLIEDCPPIIATLEAVPDEVVGWSCRGDKVIHYLYVKHAFRRLGIGSILAHGAKFYTHETRAGALLFKKTGSLFNPYLVAGV